MVGLIGLVAGAAAAVAATSSGAVGTTDRRAIEQIVRAYILDHPEILPEAMEKLQARETGKTVAANRALIETPYAGAWEGSKNPDVTLVEFFDYNCGFCRRSLPDIDRLLKDDPKLRIVYREMPVLGPDSETAAQVSLAVARTGRYATFHRALYAAPLDRATTAKVARQFGVDAGAVPSAEVQAEIANNLQLQNALRLTGTPSWIIGDKVLAGAIGYDALKAAVAEFRRKKS